MKFSAHCLSLSHAHSKKLQLLINKKFMFYSATRQRFTSVCEYLVEVGSCLYHWVDRDGSYSCKQN